MLADNIKLECCIPFCCLGNVKALRLCLYAMAWDLLVLFCWLFYNMLKLNNVGLAPLVLNFFWLFFVGYMIWDLQDGSDNYLFLRYYNVFRYFVFAFMIIFSFGMLILCFVYATDPTLESNFIDRYWALGFFFFFGFGSVIQLGTARGINQSLKVMSGGSLSELNSSLSSRYIVKMQPKKQSNEYRI